MPGLMRLSLCAVVLGACSGSPGYGMFEQAAPGDQRIAHVFAKPKLRDRPLAPPEDAGLIEDLSADGGDNGDPNQ